MPLRESQPDVEILVIVKQMRDASDAMEAKSFRHVPELRRLATSLENEALKRASDEEDA